VIKPQLCKLLVKPFNAEHWLWERKYDGFRAVVDVQPTYYTIQARSGTYKTEHFPELKFAIKGPVLVDGEIISANDLSFQEGIQPRVNRLKDQASMALELPACYMVFDILRAGDRDLLKAPLEERRVILEQALVPTHNVKVAEQYPDGVALFERAKAEGWEGVVGKNMHAGYCEGKRNWIKVKCWQEGHYHVAGFTEGTGKREPYFGALLLADCDGNMVGEVGTGFTDATLAQLKAELDKLVWAGADKVNGVYTTYLNSGDYFEVRIKYLEVTNAGQLRFPVYLGKAK